MSRLDYLPSEDAISSFGGSCIPLVTIICLAYNHDRYIDSAIRGFLIQATEFPFEIIIHDDASTDTTAAIIGKYIRQYPNLIRPIFQTENQFSKRRRIITICMPYARGRYIAVCDGDDYWIDPFKLKRQIEFLETHGEYSACFHRALTVYPDGSREPHLFPRIHKPSFDVRELILGGNEIPTASIVFRNRLHDFFPEWFEKVPFADLPLHLLNAMHGDLWCINEVMSVYRIHNRSFWQGSSEGNRNRLMIELYKVLFEYLADYRDEISYKLREKEIESLRFVSRKERLPTLLRVFCAIESTRQSGYRTRLRKKLLLSLLKVIFHLPQLYKDYCLVLREPRKGGVK